MKIVALNSLWGRYNINVMYTYQKVNMIISDKII